MIGIPTLADAILDRVIHNAYRIELSGQSLHKRRLPRIGGYDVVLHRTQAAFVAGR